MSARAFTITLRASATLLMLFYLGGGAIHALAAVLFFAGVIFPAAALFAQFGPGRSLSPGLRMSLGTLLALLAVPPFFYMRRFLPVPTQMVDGFTVLILCFAAIRTQAAASFLRGLLGPCVRACAGVLFLWLPLAFSLVWMGFGVREGNTIHYSGLFPVDFCALAGMVVAIKASPILPLNPIAGTGALSYHWFYFTMPAWLTDFMGFNLPVGPALILCNYITACLLFVVLWQTAIRFCSGPQARRHATLTALVIVFAPLITQFVLRLLPTRILEGPRNQLLLSVLNSMVAFGNNTLALTMVLLGLLLVAEWQRTKRWIHLTPCVLFLALMRGYSVTLLIPLAAACGGAMAVFAYKRSRQYFWVFIGIAMTGALVLGRIPASGADPRRVAFAFDSGRFLLTLLLGMLPLWVLALLPTHGRGSMRNYYILLAVCIVIPSIFYVENSPTGAVDLSMKIGSLAIVLLTPMAALGLQQMSQDWWQRRWHFIGCALLLAAGFLQTTLYVLQFPLSRVNPHWRRNTLELPLEYCQAMEFVRLNTPSNARVIDSEALFRSCPVNTTLFLAERIPFLPQSSELVSTRARIPELERRCELWREWESGNFTDLNLSRHFAETADILLLKGHPPLGNAWETRFRAGNYTLYVSNRRTGEKAKPE